MKMYIKVGFLPYLVRSYKKHSYFIAIMGVATLLMGSIFTYLFIYDPKGKLLSAFLACVGFIAFFWFLYFWYLVEYLKEKRAVLNEERRKLRKNAMKLLYDTVKLLEVNDDIGALENVLTLIKVFKDILSTKGSRKLMREISIFLKDLLESAQMPDNGVDLSIRTKTPRKDGPGEIISVFYVTASGKNGTNTFKFI